MRISDWSSDVCSSDLLRKCCLRAEKKKSCGGRDVEETEGVCTDSRIIELIHSKHGVFEQFICSKRCHDSSTMSSHLTQHCGPVGSHGSARGPLERERFGVQGKALTDTFELRKIKFSGTQPVDNQQATTRKPARGTISS